MSVRLIAALESGVEILQPDALAGRCHHGRGLHTVEIILGFSGDTKSTTDVHGFSRI